MRCIWKCLVGLVVLLAAGCKTTTQSDKFVASSYTDKPTKFLVAYYLSNNPAILDNRRLEQKLSEGLARCGVQSRSSMSINVSYSGFPAEHANSSTADVDAVLVLSEGGNGMARFAEAMMGGRTGETGRNYDVALFDRKTMTRVWGGSINVHGSGFLVYKTEEKTDNFARDLVGYLATDGILNVCPKNPG